MKSIKETWNNLPKGVKTGIKIAGGIVGVAAVAFASREVYKKYNGCESDQQTPAIEMVTEEEQSVVLEAAEDAPIVVID